MSKESLDYSILCPNYYTNWEEGCCMENCTHNDLDLCPIHYVKGLLEDKDQRIAELKDKLAEYEKFMKDNEWNSIEEMQETLNKCEKKYIDIQQQLDNKEKEIDERMMAFEKRCQEYYKSKEFTIEQLEKVKENIIDRLADIDRQFMEDLWDEEQYARMCWENWDTKKFIDNQIKQLKEGK